MDKIAIEITAEIKLKNRQDWVQRAAIGSVVIRDEPPTRFYVTGDSQITGGYNTAAYTDLRYLDGWRPFKRTPYNPATHKENRGKIVEVLDEKKEGVILWYTYEIKELSAQEQQDTNTLNENNESRSAAILYMAEGVKLIERVRAKLYRRVVIYPNGEMSLKDEQLAKLERWLQPTYAYLLVGNIRQAKNEISNLIKQRDNLTGDSSLSETKGMLDTATWF